MASVAQAADSDESNDDSAHTPERRSVEREPSQPHSTLSHRFRESPQKEREKSGSADSIAIMLPPLARPWEYRPYQGDTTVDSVKAEWRTPKGRPAYKIEYEDGKREVVSRGQLLSLRNGENAMDLWGKRNEDGDSTSAEEPIEEEGNSNMSGITGKRIRKKTKNDGFVNITEALNDFSEEEDGNDNALATKRRRLQNGRISNLTSNSTRQSSRINSLRGSRQSSRAIKEDESSETDEELPKTRKAAQSKSNGPAKTRSSGRTTRSGRNKPATESYNISQSIYDEDEDTSQQIEEASDNSGIVYDTRKSKRPARQKFVLIRSQPDSKRGNRRRARSLSFEAGQPTRRSGRDRVSKNMREQDMDEELYADEVAMTNTPKIISIREIFQPVEPKSQFASLHSNECDVCKGTGSNSSKGRSPLIYCQGCSSSIHKVCLGYRAGREHMVTKVGHENFVMQCRRCIGVSIKKDASAPRLDLCQVCGEVGAACAAFSPRKTSKMEEKIREENGGDDPITEVSPELINNAENLLFRCTRCQRGCHFAHLPALKKSKTTTEDEDELRNVRRKEYAKSECKDCLDYPDKPSGLVAWRLADRDNYTPGYGYYDYTEDEKEYLIKWVDQSYFQCVWMPGSWVWGITATVMRKAFANRDEGNNLIPKWTKEEAIPEEFLRMEIVFDVEYDSEFESGTEKFEKEQISLVDRVLVKFSGLGYEDAVWEAPPPPEDKERWSCFVAAYNEYVVGVHFKNPSQSEMKKRSEAFHALNFGKKVEVKKQPSSLIGGELMAYQREGMNWMLYNYHQKKNVILADEMGLGKTIQVIALLATLITEKPKCWPFLVVTPNSTCPNWRREIKKWAPSLRVVTYYGGAKARDMAKNYELFPNGNEMSAHIVVTSYEAPVNPECKAFFKKINWAGMIVDEGQRLKNDDNLLYDALKSLKTPFQCLLTGTPLQNNKRELFNLLSFLDQSLNAAKLDEKYEELTKDNLPELQDLIRPFFLRRTKLLVLKDLPTMAQVILPVSMSIVQKKLYKSILAKNPQLIKSIFGSRKTDLRPTERGNLNNILMQLRKCLCHPFIYSSAIEETSVSEEAMHRNLIDASSKFQLLELMLPKLRDRGHRVLLFSQFLNQLDLIEDFLKGLGFSFRRLDGNMGAQEKQKRIDEFNAPGSEVFAFLLSTRSGGVGINLATADTVIIMDPDFNPQQDIQAISRAHRIGQKNKVLVFQLMTKDSAEEKIIQIGRKKIALGALIETAGAEDEAGVDLESILKHGTKALFEDNDENDIRYDSASVDKLLDRAQVENTHTDDDNSAASQFSLARVWAHEKGALEEDVGDADDEVEAPNFSVWDEILKTREEEAAREAQRNMQDFGRGKRARHTVNYEKNMGDDDAPGSQPARRRSGSLSDQEFAAAGADSDVEEDSDHHSIDARELAVQPTTEQPPVSSSQQPPAIKPGDKPDKHSKAAGFGKPTKTPRTGRPVKYRITPPLPSNTPQGQAAGPPPRSYSQYSLPNDQFSVPPNSFQRQAPIPNPLRQPPNPPHFRVQGDPNQPPAILPPEQFHGGYMRPQAQAPNDFVPTMVAPSQGMVYTGAALPMDERVRRAIARIIPIQESATREDYFRVWSTPRFQIVLSNPSEDFQRRALDPIIANYGKPTQEVHRAILRAHREIYEQPLPMPPQGLAIQPPHIIQGYEYATHSPGDPNVKCPRCKLKHHISEPCDRFMNEFDVRMMLDQLRNVPPASTEPQKIRVAETYLRDKLKKISAARRARGIHNAEVIMRS